ncbi:glutamate racemase [Marinomonas dokdonensis]|uniref:glutamate racemase n=1 Tax=Marinomonas dokdonensis TaxID=328224 RepID=UPI0040559B0B
MKVGVMDSGVGGITILNAIQHQLPFLELHYLADDAFAPYGEKDQTSLQERLLKVGKYFEKLEVSAIVVACNTATVAGIEILRRHTDLPVIGVEPAVKPACRISKKREVAVLATPFTAKSERLNKLIDLWKLDSHVTIYSSASLAFDIDSWPASKARIQHTVAQLCSEMKRQQVDTLVLACTHYPLVMEFFTAEMGEECEIVEPSQGVVAQLLRRLTQAYPQLMRESKAANPASRIYLYSTKDRESTERFLHWLSQPDSVANKQHALMS